MSDIKNTLEDLSRYRTPIMGFAIVYILFHHLCLLGVNFANTTLMGLCLMGACGVDLFLILSSFGLSYSLQKSPSTSVFYKKRIARILPCFIVSLITVLSIEMISLIKNGSEMSQIITMLVDTPRYHLYSLWYIFALIPLYSIFPFVHSYIMGGDKGIEGRCKTLLLVSVINAILFIYVSYDMGVQDFYGTIMLTLFRIPVFFCGLYLLTSYKPITKIYNSHIIFVISFCVALYAPPALRYIAFFFLSLSGLKYLIALFSKFRVLNQIFSFLGKYTLEIYFAHMCVFTRIAYLQIDDNRLKIILAYILAFVFACVFHIIAKFIERKLNRVFKI